MFEQLQRQSSVFSVSQFARQSIKENGLTDIAEKIADQIVLNKSDLWRLQSQSLPMLGSMLSLSGFGDSQIPGQAVRALLRPLLCLPVAEYLESPGSSPTLIQDLLNHDSVGYALERSAMISVCPDRWSSKAPFSEICACLAEFLPSSRFRVLGPSTKDLKSLIQEHGANPEDPLVAKEVFAEHILPQLQQLSIECIHGGTSVKTHRIAAEFGLRNFVSLDLNAHRITETESSFVSQLLIVREHLEPSLDGCLPLFRTVLDSFTSSQSQSSSHPLGLEILKAVALARLCFAPHVLIQSPIALFGQKAADLALRFGANDLGFVGIHEDTAQRLELPLLSRVEELFSTTPVRCSFTVESFFPQ